MQAEDEKTLAALLLALGVVIALYFPVISDFFSDYLLHSLFFVMVFSLLPFARVQANNLLTLHPVVVPLILWQQFLLPVLVVIIGKTAGLDDQILYFVVLTLTSGSLFASPTLVQLMGLDERIAVQTVVLSTLAAPISIYGFFSILHAGPVDLNLADFGVRLFWFLVIPISIFLLVRLVIRDWSNTRKNTVDRVGRWGSVLSLVVFCFALEDQVNQSIAKEANVLVTYLIIAVFVAAIVGFLTRVVLSSYGPVVASTATVLASFRNVGLTFGLVGAIAGPEVAVYVGVCQIPMFCAPLLFDLIIGKTRVWAENAVTSESTETERETAKPGVESNETIRELNLYISILKDISSKPRSPIMSQATQAVSETVQEPVSGNTALKAQSAANPQPIPFTASSVADPEVRKELFQKLEDARALLNRLETELKEATETLVGRPGVFFGCFALIAVVLIASVWQANKYFYPMLFDDRLIAKVAETHVEGRNFGVFDLNINIRDLRNETIKRMEKTPDLVVLGASHWQEAHVSLLPGYDFYNSHVHRDYYEDMMAVTEMWVRHDRLPKEMIITIRDNLFTPVADRTDFLWYPGIKYYQDFARRIGYPAHAWYETLPYQTWRELLSLKLLLPQAQHHLASDVMPHATDGREFDGLDVLLPGGSILWSGEHKRLFTAERARNEALTFAESKKNNPPIIDPKGVAHMEALFEYLKEQGVRVTLAHPQFNPIFWDAVKDTPYREGLRRVEQLTQDWAKKYGFAFIGGFAPESVGCRAEQYIDAEHGDPACLGLLLSQYDPANGRGPTQQTSAASNPTAATGTTNE